MEGGVSPRFHRFLVIVFFTLYSSLVPSRLTSLTLLLVVIHPHTPCSHVFVSHRTLFLVFASLSRTSRSSRSSYRFASSLVRYPFQTERTEQEGAGQLESRLFQPHFERRREQRQANQFGRLALRERFYSRRYRGLIAKEEGSGGRAGGYAEWRKKEEGKEGRV
jgi:hypothetical protein